MVKIDAHNRMFRKIAAGNSLLEERFGYSQSLRGGFATTMPGRLEDDSRSGRTTNLPGLMRVVLLTIDCNDGFDADSLNQAN
jgi:hypothetical protein